jgi:hypothetical protein
MRYVLLCLFLVSAFFTSVIAEENDGEEPVLDGKTVLCEIDFLPNSYILSEQAKQVLDSVVDQLEKTDTVSKIIRIEGFYSNQDTVTDPTRISMLRALAVEDYFRVNRTVNFERFLTGHNNSNTNCCAQIIIYSNPWHDVTDPVQVTDRDKIDGPS